MYTKIKPKSLNFIVEIIYANMGKDHKSQSYTCDRVNPISKLYLSNTHIQIQSLSIRMIDLKKWYAACRWM